MKKTIRGLKAFKIVGGLIISIGVGAVVTNVIKATTPEDVKRVTNFCIKVGGFFVAGMTAAAANHQFDKTIDGFIAAVQVLHERMNEMPEIEIEVEV